jgi:NAD+ synthase (glutamine-hydrolysing)
MEELSKLNPDIIINIAASPFAYTKVEAKENIFRNKALRYGLPVISVNQTGANTELIFDGASIAFDRKGEIFRRLPFFAEAVETFELDDLLNSRGHKASIRPDTIPLVYKALTTGIRDYFRKSGFSKCILGLSGGMDSAICLCLAADALGNENVRAVLMPSRYSSEHSITDSIDLARNLGISYEIINIEEPFSAFSDILAPVFKGRKEDVTEENIQARIRAVILMGNIKQVRLHAY